MERVKLFLALVILAPLGCGGGGEPNMPPPTDGDGMVMLKMGAIFVSAKPAVTMPMASLFVDGKEKSQIATGTDGMVTVVAGTHNVQIKTPGYGYAVPGYSWTTSGSFQVDRWVMRDVTVPAEGMVKVEAILCRDLTGKWKTGGAGIRATSLESRDGSCEMIGFSPFKFQVNGDTLTTDQSAGGCAGMEAKILENGTVIELDCGDGDVYTSTRQ